MRLDKTHVAIILLWTMGALLSCTHEKRQHAPAIADRTATPVLDVDSVTTLISDSGVTKYRISAPRWKIYDKAPSPYWEFEQGILLEQFDSLFEVDVYVKSKYAIYWSEEERWELVGEVFAKNSKGETFSTPQLRWEQKTERIFSDATIHIQRESSILEGVGFDSNQSMTEYTILSPTGYFPIEE